MCKERRIPEILICSPCDAVTEEDAEKEYELRKHYKRVFRRGEPKCCTFKYIAFAINNANPIRCVLQEEPTKVNG